MEADPSSASFSISSQSHNAALASSIIRAWPALLHVCYWLPLLSISLSFSTLTQHYFRFLVCVCFLFLLLPTSAPFHIALSAQGSLRGGSESHSPGCPGRPLVSTTAARLFLAGLRGPPATSYSSAAYALSLPGLNLAVPSPLFHFRSRTISSPSCSRPCLHLLSRPRPRGGGFSVFVSPKRTRDTFPKLSTPPSCQLSCLRMLH